MPTQVVYANSFARAMLSPFPCSYVIVWMREAIVGLGRRKEKVAHNSL